MKVHCIILSTLGMLANICNRKFRKFYSRGLLGKGNEIPTEKVWHVPPSKLRVEGAQWLEE